MNTWSRGRTLGIGVGLIVLANAVALGGVWWNRSAIPESALTLSERELGLPWRTLRFAEDSGLSLNLNWRVSGREAGDFVSGYTFNGGTPEWLDATHMAALGFAPDDLARQLRERYPDRSRFLLLYGTVRPALRDRGSDAAQATGYVSRISTGRIHVPHALRGPLESARAAGEPGGGDRFSAQLLVGQRLEPWIVELKPVAR